MNGKNLRLWKKLAIGFGSVTALLYGALMACNADAMSPQATWWLGGTALLAVAGAVLLLTRSLARPIVRMAAFAESALDGRVDEVLDLNRSDEIGALASKIHTMADCLAQTRSELATVRQQAECAASDHKKLEETSGRETERAQAEARQATENFNSIPMPIMALDRDYNVTFVNKMAADVAGVAQEECVGKKCYELFENPHCRTPECRCRQAMENDGIFNGETVVKPNGQTLSIQYTGSPIKDQDGGDHRLPSSPLST